MATKKISASEKRDLALDKKQGVKEDSKRDKMLDKKATPKRK